MATFRDEYIIEQFSLEEKHYKELSNLITDTFLADPAAQLDGASVIFNEEIFRTFFGSPSVDRELFVRTKIKATGEIIGFLGLIPRKLKIKDKIYKFAVPSWLSVHPKHQRKGIGSAMGYHMLESLKARGYDGAFGIFEPEQHGLDTYKSVVRKVNISIKRLVTI
ncbi:MAG: GNAT family N-acetyltransferase, partial [Candidatus Heimdallarchaeota archaeon]